MFKPVHAAIGTLISNLSGVATNAEVDDKLFCVLEKALRDGSYTYVMLSNNFDYEIVKVTGTLGNTLVIERAQDGTTAIAFPVGSEMKFVLAQTAIEDIINEKALGEVNITGEGIVEITKAAKNTFVISAPKVQIRSDSEKILVGGEFPNFILSTPLNQDCCD